MMAKGLFVFDFGLLFSMKVVTKLFRFNFQYLKFSLTSLVKVNWKDSYFTTDTGGGFNENILSTRVGVGLLPIIYVMKQERWHQPEKDAKQAGAELGQAQLKLQLGFPLTNLHQIDERRKSHWTMLASKLQLVVARG